MKKILLSLAVISFAAFGAVAETLNLTGWEFQGASDWGSNYAQRTVEFDNATVTFASANKQSGTITDCPVTKGGNITVTSKNAALTSVKFNLKQWTTKAQTATLYVSTNGTEFTATTTSSSNFVLDAPTLPEGTVAAQVRFSSSSNQVGLASIDVTYAGGAAAEMETELTITPVWVNNVIDGESNPIPGLDAGWNKPTPTHQSTATATRFATGKDGKIFVNNHMENAIYTWDGKEMAKYLDLPAVTDEKWNGTALTTDDAGNLILNFNFTDAVNSLRNWAVVGKDKKLTEVTLSTTEAELGTHGRLDIISHIVGDVTSAEGGIGYSTTKGSDKIVMFHFTGNGTTVTAVTAKVSSSVPGLAAVYGAGVQTETYQAAPKYLTVAELLNGTPENNFYLPVGKLGATNATVLGFESGELANFDGTTYAPLTMGNRGYGSVATFEIGGQKYIVRNYINPNSANATLLTNWRNVLTFGVFDLEGNCVATWDASTYSNSYGSETYSIEKVDANTVNLYIYAATGNDDLDTPRNTLKGAYGGMFTITAKQVPAKPNGSKELPYIISTPEDIVNMISKLRTSGYTYFEFDNDIDMAGVTYTAPAQSAVANVHLDGNNHVIKNLTINGPFAGLFARMNGSVKNLGFIDIDLSCPTWGGAGAIAGYIANDEPTTIENCFVTGKISGVQAQLGAFACGNYHEATISNCYSNATLTSTGGGIQGGFVGAIMFTTDGSENSLTINNSYFAGSVTGAQVGGFVGANQSYTHPATGTEVLNLNNCALLSASLTGTAVNAYANNVGGTLTVNADNVMVGNKTTLNGAAVEDAVAEATIVKAVMAWEGFNSTEVSETTQLPILAWQTGVKPQASGTEEDPFIIATAADLCNVYKYVQGGEYWFKQTADIDMADVKVYHAIAGYNGNYSSTIHYDGQNHLIKNFAPNDRGAGDDNGYYCTSIFGVAAGEISNLGVVDAKIVTAQGAGILAGYGGYSATNALILDNVFVTGEVTGTGGYTGGMIGTNGNWLTMTNCFANVKVTGKAFTGGILGRASNNVDMEDVYVAGTVTSTAEDGTPYLVMDKNKNITYNGWQVVAFNTGAEKAMPEDTELGDEAVTIASADDAAAVAKVAAWKQFSAEKTVYGLPGLASFEYTVAAPIVANSIKETLSLESKTTFTVNYELTVGFVNSKNIFACDAAGDFIQLYGENTLKVGDVIPAGWEATYELYNNVTPELTGFTLPAVTEGTFTAPVVAAADVTTALVNHVVTIKNVVLAEETPAKKENFTGKVGDVELSFRNNYTLPSVEAGCYNITVVVIIYNGEPSLYVTNYEAAVGTGTADDPYIIATANDLCNAYKKVLGGEYWFVQTADIDMADVKDYHAIAGYNGVYTNIIHYDGQNHLIKNFAPTDRAAMDDNGYYCTSIFGVASGEIMNLGVVDAKIVTAQGAGILAAYAGHSTSSALIVDDVFVTGEVTTTGDSGYTGGMFGTNGNILTMRNCFANVKVSGRKFAAGLLGRASKDVNIENTYVAGSVESTLEGQTPYLFFGKNADINYNGWEVVAFNTGAEAAIPADTKLLDETVNIASADDAAAVAKVAAWKHFSAEKTVLGLPGLASFDYTAELPAEQDGTKEHPYLIETVEDLCNAYLKVKANIAGATYFVQTADIDMAGVKDWHAINGFNGTYTAAFSYDGQNHLIKNFSPEVTAPDPAMDNYYMGSIFGVLSGEVKNLGIVDANVVNNQQGGGFLAAYAGHGDAMIAMYTGLELPRTYIQNVFVTGTYDATDNENYIGGLAGTTNGYLTIEDCFVNADIKAQNNVAGFVGRLRNQLQLTRSYVAGTVSGTGANVALAVASDKTPEIIVDDVYAFNTGASEVVVGAKPDDDIFVVDVNDTAAIENVAAWAAFSAEKTVYGLPGLASFDYTAAKANVANSIKETIAMASSTKLTVNYELTVGFVNNNNVFACDAAGDFIQLYGENTLKVGDVIPAGWEATYELFNNVTPELTNFTLPEVTEGSFTAAVVAAADVTAELVNHVITINGVELSAATPATKSNFTGKVGDIELNFRNNYTLASVEAGKYNITVVVNVYQGAVQLYVVNYEKNISTGIYDIDADDAEAVYYNLQGVRVENPESGLYIRVRGNKVDKVVK